MKSCPPSCRRRRRRTNRRGIVLILAALLLVALLTFCALAIDVGYMCVARAELQRTADAAVLASVSAMQNQAALNVTPNLALVRRSVRLEAQKYSSLNPCRSVTVTLPVDAYGDLLAGSNDLLLGHYNSTSTVFSTIVDPNSTTYNSAFVCVRRDAVRNGPVELFLAAVFGRHSVDMSAAAAAYMENDIKGFQIANGSDALCQLLPFSLDIGLWDNRGTAGFDAFTHNPVTKTISTGADGVYEINIYLRHLTAGNYGTIDLGSPNNKTPDIRRQILYGVNAYDLSFFPNSTIQLTDGSLQVNGDCGISAAIQTDLQAIRGQPRVLPLHSWQSGNGNNAIFNIVRFVGVTIVDCQLSTGDKYVKVQTCYTRDDTAIPGGNEWDIITSKFIITSEFISKSPRLRKLDANGH